MSMKKGRKLIMSAVLASTVVALSGCSFSGIKIVEKIENSSTEKENKPREFEHAGLTFVENNKTMYAIKNTPCKDSLEDGGAIVAEVKKGDEINVLGIDKTNKYAVIKIQDTILYISNEDLSDKKIEKESTLNNKAVDKTALDKLIKELAGLKEADYEEKEFKELIKIFPENKAILDNKNAKQEDVNKAVKLLTEQKNKLKKKGSAKTENHNKPSEKPNSKPETQEKTGIPYPPAPDDIELYDGITFAILKDVNAEVVVESKLYTSSVVGAESIQDLKPGDKVKVLAIGTNDFARVEFTGGKVGFIKASMLKKN